VVGVAQVGPGCVGADVVAEHLVQGGAVIEYLNAVATVAGNNVALSVGGATDHIVCAYAYQDAVAGIG
jgi:hypothetical protein